MRFLFLILFFGALLVFLGSVLYYIGNSIKGFFESKSSDRKNSEFYEFINNYFKNKSIDNDNIQTLQIIARDIMKSKMFKDEERKYNFITGVLLCSYFIISVFILFLISNNLNGDESLINTMLGIGLTLIIAYIFKRRQNKKELTIFENIPLNKSQSDKLGTLTVKGRIKEYIDERLDKEHAFNGGDLIFISNMLKQGH